MLLDSLHYTSLSIPGSPGGTDYGGVRFPIHRGWNGRDFSMAGICDCVIKECVSFIMEYLVS